jgi:hypothetical protein
MEPARIEPDRMETAIELQYYVMQNLPNLRGTCQRCRETCQTNLFSCGGEQDRYLEQLELSLMAVLSGSSLWANRKSKLFRQVFFIIYILQFDDLFFSLKNNLRKSDLEEVVHQTLSRSVIELCWYSSCTIKSTQIL